MFNTLGRRSTFVYRMIFANMWLFKGVLDMICKKSGGELNAMMRTTVAFTQAEGSQGVNVIPPVASITANMRINPNDSVKLAEDYIKKVKNWYKRRKLRKTRLFFFHVRLRIKGLFRRIFKGKNK